MSKVKRITESILKGRNIRKALSPSNPIKSRKLVESVSADIVEGVKKSFKEADDVDRFYNWLSDHYEEDEDLEEDEVIEKYAEEYAQYLVSFVEDQIKQKNVWSAYFPDFDSSPYWYKGYNKDGAICGSGCGDFTKDWIGWSGSVEEDIANESGGGDYSEISPGNCNASIEDIEKMEKVVDATGENEDDRWCIYKGSLKYWVDGDCDDNIPEIGINSAAVLYYDDLSISNTSPSNVKKAIEIIKKHYDAVSGIDLWPGETLKSFEDGDPEKEIVQKMVDELEAAGFKVENNF